jgi:hypothetical protein
VQRAAVQGEEAFLEAAAEFSNSAYLGFTVIKPLAGSPVGRTVLKTYPDQTDDAQQRMFTCVRRYSVHVNGVPLHVEGLPFQQQDVGVSACATTAIWSSIQKARDQEELPAATPAQITTLASRYALPFGRAFPADEGLSIDQMCQAVQGLGLSPHLYAATDFETTRNYIDTALRSEMSPVLILRDAQEVHHAVAAVGRFDNHLIPDPPGQAARNANRSRAKVRPDPGGLLDLPGDTARASIGTRRAARPRRSPVTRASGAARQAGG